MCIGSPHSEEISMSVRGSQTMCLSFNKWPLCRGEEVTQARVTVREEEKLHPFRNSLPGTCHLTGCPVPTWHSHTRTNVTVLVVRWKV